MEFKAVSVMNQEFMKLDCFKEQIMFIEKVKADQEKKINCHAEVIFSTTHQIGYKICLPLLSLQRKSGIH